MHSRVPRTFLVAMTALFVVCASVPSAEGTVAITEFLVNPTSLDAGREYLELFNYGTSAVDLTGWTLEDEDSDLFTFGATSIASGDFLIVVNGDTSTIAQRLSAAEVKQVFEEEWLGGVADSRVIGIEGKTPPSGEGTALANSADELILKDSGGTTIWSVAYANDDDNGIATYHTSTQLWTVANTYGSKAEPGVDREGDDNGQVGFLGYEHAATGSAVDGFTPIEAAGFESDPSNLEAFFGPNGSVFVGPYDSSDPQTDVGANFGSPLAGNYQVMPTNGVVGDYDGDGFVTAADYTVWQDTFGSQTDLRADGNDNMIIDDGDLTVWQNAFPSSGSGAGLASVAIPEPASGLLALLALPALIRGRRSRALR